MARYGTQMRPIDHHDDPCKDLVPPAQHDGRRQRSGFDRARHAVQTVTHADVIGRRARQERLQQPCCLAKGVSRAQLGLQALQVCRAAVRQKM